MHVVKTVRNEASVAEYLPGPVFRGIPSHFKLMFTRAMHIALVGQCSKVPYLTWFSPPGIGALPRPELRLRCYLTELNFRAIVGDASHLASCYMSLLSWPLLKLTLLNSSHLSSLVIPSPKPSFLSSKRL